MASILRTLAGQGGKKKKSSSSNSHPRIINAGFEESSCESVVSTSEIIEGSNSATSSSSLSLLSIEESKLFLQKEHSILSEETADRLFNECCNDDGWEVWDTKENMIISKKKKSDGTIMGRGEIKWLPIDTSNGKQLYDFNFVEDYLWDDKAKSQYDEFTEKMLVLHEYKGEQFHVVDQVFKGRFGICGREFILLVAKHRKDTGTHDILVIPAVSIPPNHVTTIETLMDSDKLETYKQLSSKVVRGVCHLAGYVITRDRLTNEHRLIYINDADVKSKGVPQWIVTRVKLDQLKIVKAIPECIEKAALEALEQEDQKGESLESIATAAGEQTATSETAKSVI